LEAYLKKCLANDPHITFTNYAPKADVVIAEEGNIPDIAKSCPIIPPPSSATFRRLIGN